MGDFDGQISFLMYQIDGYQNDIAELEEKKEQLEEAKKKLFESYEDVEVCKDYTVSLMESGLPWMGNQKNRYFTDIWESLSSGFDSYLKTINDAEDEIDRKIQDIENKIAEMKLKLKNAQSGLRILQSKNRPIYW